jgi:hypothetical protein
MFQQSNAPSSRLNTGRLHLYASNDASGGKLAGAHTLVRYELILQRAPKLRAVDIEPRMGDLPDELSLGSLQRALEEPECGPIAIAWGDNRKRLHLIQRRIAIMGGEALLVDRAGPLRQRLTDWTDTLLSPFRKDEAAAARSSQDGPAYARIAWSCALLLAIAAALLWRYGDKLPLPPWVRPRALQLAGCLLGATLAQVLVSGVRMWLEGPGRRSLAAGCMLLSLSSLGAASYQARELGIWKRASALKASLTHDKQQKPNMKPFTALMVELERRQQRRELTAALERSAPKSPAPGESPAEPATLEAMQPQAILSATVPAQPSQPTAASPQPAASQPAAPQQANTSRPLSATDLPRETSERSARATAAHGGIAGDTAQARAIAERTASTDPNARQTPAILQPEQPSGPWRTLDDVNPIHGALAAGIALLTFALGVRVGRRGQPKREVDAGRAGDVIAPSPPLDAAPQADKKQSTPPRSETDLLDANSFPPQAANDTSAAIAAASAQRLAAEAPRAGRRGAATGGAGFSVQEARVSPRKRDARSDD